MLFNHVVKHIEVELDCQPIGSISIGDHVDLLDVIKFARQCRGGVRLILMVRNDNLDRLAQHLAALSASVQPGTGPLLATLSLSAPRESAHS
jgi:hypothetical protein